MKILLTIVLILSISSGFTKTNGMLGSKVLKAVELDLWVFGTNKGVIDGNDINSEGLLDDRNEGTEISEELYQAIISI